jgi:hypothetical protein
MARSPSICGVILTDETTVLADHPAYLTGAIELLLPRTEMVIVVAGANADSVAPTVYTRGASLVVNSSPRSGKFGWLKTGLQEILSRGRDAALVVLADRTSTAAAILDRLEAEFLDALESGQWAAVAEFEGSRDYPFYAGREMIEAYLRAPLGATAEDVEKAHADRIRYVTFPDEAAKARSEHSIPVL